MIWIFSRLCLQQGGRNGLRGEQRVKLLNNALYIEDIKRIADKPFPWDKLSDTSILIAGATGLIGRCFVDLLMYMNEHRNLHCHITAISSNIWSARKRFPERYFESEFLKYIQHDISESSESFKDLIRDRYAYIFHFASNTHPVAYSERPIDTILTNVYGTRNLLDICSENFNSRFIFPSSVEIYGENRGDVELFREDYLGYINSNTLRAGYPESKRVCESLCQAYIKERKLQVVIPRLPRVFGPTMQKNDSKALAQFIRKAIVGEDIVLKSQGNQYYSFLYVMDAVTGVLTTMFYGENGVAYNISDETCDGTLRNAAEICASCCDSKLTYEVPDEIEKQGYSTATKARLDGTKIKGLGWKPYYNLENGIRRTIEILQQSNEETI